MSKAGLHISAEATAVQGPRGLSIKEFKFKETLSNGDNVYQVILENNTVIGELTAKKGDKGLKGDTGEDGNGIISILFNRQEDTTRYYTVTYTNGMTNEIIVENGDSAYDIAVTNGFNGTEEEWLESLIGKGLEFEWKGTELGVRVEGETNYKYVDLKGERGKNIEFTWRGTELGVRIEGQTSYQYVNLKGDKGEKGDQGIQGIQGPKGDKGDTADTSKKLDKGLLPATVPDGKTIYDLLENNCGINIDTALLYLNDTGTKTKGKMYFDRNKKGLFECIQTTTTITNSTTYFYDISNKANDDRIKNINIFKNSLISDNGYTIFKNGLIYQWGSVSVSGVGFTKVNFPIQFPNKCFGVFSSIDKNVQSEVWRSLHSVTNSSVYIAHDNSKKSYWFAIGY